MASASETAPSPSSDIPRQLLLGLADHLHPDWRTLYPEDMPEDWYLAWYANEFQALLVPEHQWMQEKDFALWLDEATLVHLWHLQCGTISMDMLNRLDRLRHKTSAHFRLLCQQVPDQDTQETLEKLEITALGPACTSSPCWTRDPDNLMANDHCLGFMFKGDTSLPLRQLRQLLERLGARSSTRQPAALLLEPGPLGLHNLEQCQTLLRLMGLD